MLSVLKALLLILQAIPALRELAAQVERLHRERQAEGERRAKDARNDAALAEAQKAVEHPPRPPAP